jgi:hypothetical protein
MAAASTTQSKLPHEYATDDETIWFLCPLNEFPDAYTVVYRKLTEEDVDITAITDYERESSFVRCCCSACWSCSTGCRDDKSEDHTTSATRNIANKHCIHCMCKDCVCDFKRARGLYESWMTPADAYFDNGCGGYCTLCQRFKDKSDHGKWGFH